MFHRGRCIRGQDRGSGLRGGRAGLTGHAGHAGKRWRRPDGGAGRIWPEARPGTSGPAYGIAPAKNSAAIASRIRGAELRGYEGGHLFLFQDPAALPEYAAFLQAPSR